MTSTLGPLAYRRVVGRFATGVTVVTTVLPGGDRHGLTCNSFTSVSLEPVLVLFCAEKVARHDAVPAGRHVGRLGAVHVPPGRLPALRLARARPQQFEGVPALPGEVTGAPLLVGAIAALECRTASVSDAGDHSVVIGEVLAATLPDPEAPPLLYHEGGYRTVHAPGPA